MTAESRPDRLWAPLNLLT